MEEESSQALESKATQQSVVHPMRYGFIYPLANHLVNAINYLNLVELFKNIAARLAGDKNDSIYFIRIGVDIFVVLKWAFLIIIWLWGQKNTFFTILIWYLLLTNVFTYFYRHVWIPPFDSSDENLRSRLVTLIISMIFSIACFAYLYSVPFAQHFKLDADLNPTVAAILFSTSRSFLIDFTPLNPVSISGHVIMVIQTAITFLFISIILSASIPQYHKAGK